MCLCVAVKCWYLTLSDIIKKDFESFNPTTLSETIQRILLGEATLSFDDNEHINVVSENGMTSTVQRMDERLDKLGDLLKSESTST